MRKLNAPGDSVQDVFSTCIESYRDAALKNRLRSIVPVLSDEASRFEDCVLTSKTHTIPTADNVGGQRVSSYLFCAETCSVERLAVQAG